MTILHYVAGKRQRGKEREKQLAEISLREVTRENWRVALQLTVRSEQQRFISGYAPIVAIALAKAYIRPDGCTWKPYAFYLKGEMIGFVVLAYESRSKRNYWLYHFFVDQRYQGQGYGKQAMRVFLRFFQAQYPQCEVLQLTVHPENVGAQHLYRSVGFQPTGEEIDAEPVYALLLNA